MLNNFVVRDAAKDHTVDELEKMKKAKEALEREKYAIYPKSKTKYHSEMNNVAYEICIKDATYHNNTKKRELIKRCQDLLHDRGYVFAYGSSRSK